MVAVKVAAVSPVAGEVKITVSQRGLVDIRPYPCSSLGLATMLPGLGGGGAIIETTQADILLDCPHAVRTFATDQRYEIGRYLFYPHIRNDCVG